MWYYNCSPTAIHHNASAIDIFPAYDEQSGPSVDDYTCPPLEDHRSGLPPKSEFLSLAERLKLVRKANAIVEEELKDTGAFHYMAILHEDRVTGMRNNQREFGSQIEVRCWDSVDARTVTPTRLPFETLEEGGRSADAQGPRGRQRHIRNRHQAAIHDGSRVADWKRDSLPGP